MSKTMIYISLAFLSIVWGTTWIAIKYTLIGVPPLAGATLRFLCALVILYVIARWRGVDLSLPKGALGPILLAAFLLYPMDYGLIYWGEQYLNAGVTAVFFATYPLFTGLISNFWLRAETIDPRKYIGLSLGLFGTVVVFYDQVDNTSFDTQILLASAAIVLSAFCGALSVIILKKYLGKINILSMTIHQMWWGTLSLAILSIASGELQRNFSFPMEVIVAVLYLGAVASALAFVMYYQLLRNINVISLSYIIYITPLVALLAGWWLLDEKLTVQILVGTAIIFAGIFFSQDRSSKTAEN